jgi:hypothetical protein
MEDDDTSKRETIPDEQKATNLNSCYGGVGLVVRSQ